MQYKDKTHSITTIPHTPEDDIIKSKVLFACINAPSYSPAGQVEGFRKLGYEVMTFDWQHIRYEIGIEDMLERLIVKATIEKPELIFLQLQNPDILDVPVAKELSKHGFVINFSEDVRDDISWYEEIAPHIGLTVFTNADDVEKLKAKGIDNVCNIFTSYNDKMYQPTKFVKFGSGDYWMPQQKDYGEIVFIGNNYLNTNLNFPKAKERQEMIDFMKKEFGERFQCYGIGQENKMLSMAECVEAYNSCKIAVTQNNFTRKQYTSDRTFNAIGSRAFTVCQYFEGIEKLRFMPLIAWKDFDQLKLICNYFLTADVQRKEIAKRNYEQVLNNHTWYHRFLELQSIINQLMSK